MENKNSSLILTVIAVATLMVAVVGASFAFFQAQGGTAVAKDVKVQTGTAGNTTFSIANAINITADQNTFGSGKGDRIGSTTGTASFTAPSQVSGALNATDLKSCYTVTLNITSNGFTYTVNSSTPELLLDVTKGNASVISSQDITTKTGNIQVPTAASGTTYVHTLQTTAGQTITDNWTVKVTLKNLSTNQNANAGQSFAGTLKFDAATCS